MKYHTLIFFRKLGKMSQNVSSAAVVIGALRVKLLSLSSVDRTMRSYKGRLLHLFYMMFLVLHWNKTSSYPSRKENDNDFLQTKPSSESGVPSFSDILGKNYGNYPVTERQSVASTRGQRKNMFQYPNTEPCSKPLVGDSYEYEPNTSSDQSKSHVEVRRHSKKQV